MAGDSFGWGDVTLREFAALDIIRDPDAVTRLNRYWDELHVNPANMWPGETPGRLTPEGVAWLADLHERFTVDTPADEAARMAREVLDGLGILLVMNVPRVES